MNGDTRVARYTANAAHTSVNTGSRRLLFSLHQPFSNHNGGRLQFGPNGRLYTGQGDGGSGCDPGGRAQNLRSKLGKLLSLNPRNIGAGWRIDAYGLRNPWGYSVRPPQRPHLHRRRRPGQVRRGRHASGPPARRHARELHVGRLRGLRAERLRHERPQGPRRPHPPDQRLQPLARAARSPAATTTAATRSRRSEAGTSSPTSAPGTSGASSSPTVISSAGGRTSWTRRSGSPPSARA